MSSKTGIGISCSDVERHKTIGAADPYQDTLKRPYHKIRHSESSLRYHLTLQYKVKEMNDPVITERLDPFLLVFGMLPKIPVVKDEIPNHAKCVQALLLIRVKMKTNQQSPI